MQHLPAKSENQTLIFEFKKSLAVAFERVGTEPYNVDSLINDVLSEFKGITVDEVKEALRRGSLGRFGKTYKLTTQDVCIWIAKNRELKKHKPLL